MDTLRSYAFDVLRFVARPSSRATFSVFRFMMHLFVFQVCLFLYFQRSFQCFLYLNWYRLFVLINCLMLKLIY